MATAVIGEPFTFQHLFLDTSGNPLVVGNPRIEIYYFNSVGVKVALVAAGTPMGTVIGDIGRYSYTFTIPSTLNSGLTIYGLLSGDDLINTITLTTEQEVSLQDSCSVVTGLNARFIK